MSDDILIPFAGPFSWAGTPGAPCVLEADEAHKIGIYLWTVPLPDGHLIYYVGETGRSFAVRLRQHYEELIGARYHIYSAAEFARGEKVLLWPGRFDVKSRKSDAECQANCSRLSAQIQEMVSVLRFFIAPLNCDTRVRRRIEAAMAQALYDAPGLVGGFQDQGVHYWPRTASEGPIECVLSSPARLMGLPQQFSV